MACRSPGRPVSIHVFPHQTGATRQCHGRTVVSRRTNPSPSKSDVPWVATSRAARWPNTRASNRELDAKRLAHARRGRDLATHPKTAQRRPSELVGGHTRHGIVGRRSDRNDLHPRIDTVFRAMAKTVGNRSGNGGPYGPAGIQEDPVSRLLAPPDGPRHNVSRRQLRIGMQLRHEAMARIVDQPGPFTPQRLGH